MATHAPGEQNIELIQVAGRTYRKAPIKKKEGKKSSVRSLASTYEDEEDSTIENKDYTLEADKATSTYKLTFTVPSVYYKFIIGKKAQTKNKIQNDTGATIILPKQDSGDETIGPSENSVTSAKTRIDLTVNSAHKFVPYTHFISIPLTEMQFQRSVSNFFSEISSKFQQSKGFDSTIFVNELQLHLNLFMLKLHSKDAKLKVEELLKKSSAQIYDILETRTLILNLQGLEYMNDNPAAVDVLYVKVQEAENGNRLKRLIEFLGNKLVEANLIESEDKDVKLHVTIINTKLRRNSKPEKEEEEEDNQPEKPSNPKDSKDVFETAPAKNRIPFDATGIMTQYKDYSFGKCKVSGIEISDRSTFAENGYWKSIANVSFP